MENLSDNEETGTNSNNEDGNRPACAACKHQRKKCKKGCPFFLHFPANKHQEFSAVHQIFGVSNITKMMKDMDLAKQGDVVDSMIWEAMIWTNKDHREYGPLGIYKKLQEDYTKLQEDYKKLQEDNKALKEIYIKSYQRLQQQRQFQCQASSPAVVASYSSSPISTTQEAFGLGFQGSSQQTSRLIVNRPQQHNQMEEKGPHPQLPLSTSVQAILPPTTRSSQLENNTTVGRIPSQLIDNLRLKNRYQPYYLSQRFIHGSEFGVEFGFLNQPQACQQNHTVQNNFTAELHSEVKMKIGTKDNPP